MTAGIARTSPRSGASPGIDNDDPAVVAQRLLQGPLDFSRLIFKQMEINAQVVRFPSDLENMENRKFAGQAIYWMRIFALRDGKFQPTRLENTPDVQAILKDPAKQKQLQDYLASHIGRDRQRRIQDAGEPGGRYRAEFFHCRQRARGQSSVRSRNRQRAGGTDRRGGGCPREVTKIRAIRRGSARTPEYVVLHGLPSIILDRRIPFSRRGPVRFRPRRGRDQERA